MDIEIDKKYSTLLTSDCRYHIVTGGRGSGKSFAINTLLCYMLEEEQRTILFLRKTLTSAHLSIVPEFLEKLELLGVKDDFHVTKTEIINKNNGSIIYFRGIQTSSSDNTANLKSINGVSIAVIDEAEELTDEATFDRLDLSVRKKGVINKVIVALNPCTKVHFLYRRFFEDMGINGGYNGQKENVNYIHTTYLDNINNLDESFLYQAELLKLKNPNKYNHVLLGGWLEKSEGVIFENWSIGEFKETSLTRWGNDMGFSNDPTTLVKIAIDKANERIYLREECYKTRMTTDDIAIVMSHRAGKELIIADSAEPRLIEELNKKGLNVKGAAKGSGSIKDGIGLMLNYHLVVSPCSINLIKELNNYAWSDKRSETPIDAHNHIIDGARYAITDALTTVVRNHGFGWGTF